jgi:hypothetical protein
MTTSALPVRRVGLTLDQAFGLDGLNQCGDPVGAENVIHYR